MEWWTSWQVSGPQTAGLRACVRVRSGADEFVWLPVSSSLWTGMTGATDDGCGQPLSSLQYSTPGWGFVGVIVSL